MRPRVELFGLADLASAVVLKARNEWDLQQRNRALEEKTRFEAGLPFNYEPHHYAWCAFFTSLALVERARDGDRAALNELQTQGGAAFNPVTGEVSPIYVLCSHMNPTGECPNWNPRTGDH
jgi:hypothetical protein